MPTSHPADHDDYVHVRRDDYDHLDVDDYPTLDVTGHHYVLVEYHDRPFVIVNDDAAR